MSKIFNLLQRLKFETINICKECHPGCKAINSYAWMNYDGTIDHSNWGDDINWYFLKEIIDGPVVPYFHSKLTKLFNRPNYVAIGSTIDLLANQDSIIWGAGIIDSKTETLPKFKEIRAVRGPLTRRKLIEMGFSCPEVYGDPALLIPLHYMPKIRKKYRLGIIPHFHDLEIVRRRWDNIENIKLIDIRNYNHWQDFINEILECESIASSSLHGLIMSHAYNIPNVWIEFNGSKKRDSFKYNDFYASVGKTETPLIINDTSDIKTIESALTLWRRGNINLKPLIDNAPFKLKL